MSAPIPAPIPASVSANIPYSPFRERLLSCLLPYFLPLTANFNLARAEALETLESYGARTRSEMINAMRIISLSFASMDLLAATNGADMPPDMRLHYIRHANSLARTCQQNENALAKRLAADPPPAVEQAGDPAGDPAGDQAVEPIDDISAAEVELMIQQTQAQIDAYRKSAPNPRAIAELPQQPWGSVIVTATAAQNAPPHVAPS
jgi:hypothetical protein